jgi:hypothetical protein
MPAAAYEEALDTRRDRHRDGNGRSQQPGVVRSPAEQCPGEADLRQVIDMVGSGAERSIRHPQLLAHACLGQNRQISAGLAQQALAWPRR